MVEPAYHYVLCGHYMLANGYGPYDNIHSANKNAIAQGNGPHAVVYECKILDGAIVAHFKYPERQCIYPGPAENACITAFFMVERIYKMAHPPAWPYPVSGGEQPEAELFQWSVRLYFFCH
jgi:hypothetical protein